MVGLKFLSLAATAVFLLARGATAGAVKSTAERVNCTSAMNAARNGGAFVALNPAEDPAYQLPITTTSTTPPTTSTSNDAYIKKVCAAMKNKTPISTTTKPDGIFAYAVQTEEKPDCEAAVDYWKKAYSTIGDLPPAFSNYTTAPYNDANNVSLMSLFNPKDDPTVDCAYFKCADASEASVEFKALLCVTTPNALKKNEQPFTEDEWKRINTAINSGSAAVPTAIVVGAAALAALFL
ncbi:SAG family member [Eimeria maxima]|uniref:SAG family member n=1 Tax=Eimeria maxima TaxID=5804 RepID=U6M5M3_EIMMA|nr:SAG family member [Eimeria maxima]CDJ56970.1 SAG family member [Eimeria maxima]